MREMALPAPGPAGTITTVSHSQESGDGGGFDLGPVPDRPPIGDDVVRRLIDTQFPQWSDLPLRRVAEEGWDNRTFHLGDDLSVRLPSAEPYAHAVIKEHHWLPLLRPQLPLSIPEPVGLGEPGSGYPHPWSVYRWLPGTPSGRDKITDLTAFGSDLAGFLAALQAVDPAGGPGPGLHNWYRGGPLTTFSAMVEGDLADVPDEIAGPALATWKAALAADWDRRPVWFHGDIAAGNLLLRDGALGAVIDFGTCGVGDPACDLAIAWTMLDGPSRAAFRERLAVDDATWERGRGWALWKALSGVAWAIRDGDEAPDSRRTLAELAAEA